MKIVIQRVSRASVRVEGKEIAQIGKGLLLLVGIAQDDTEAGVCAKAKKIASMRIFSDEKGKFNHSLLDISGDVLVVSQFTLIADTKKGNRPSFIRAATPELANTLYTAFSNELKRLGVRRVEKGVFGAHMSVSLVNDGPVTIVL